MYGLMEHSRQLAFIDFGNFGVLIVSIMCLVSVLLLFLVIETLQRSVTPWSLRFSSISDSGTYCGSGSEMTPLLLFNFYED